MTLGPVVAARARDAPFFMCPVDLGEATRTKPGKDSTVLVNSHIEYCRIICEHKHIMRRSATIANATALHSCMLEFFTQSYHFSPVDDVSHLLRHFLELVIQ